MLYVLHAWCLSYISFTYLLLLLHKNSIFFLTHTISDGSGTRILDFGFGKCHGDKWVLNATWLFHLSEIPFHVSQLILCRNPNIQFWVPDSSLHTIFETCFRWKDVVWLVSQVKKIEKVLSYLGFRIWTSQLQYFLRVFEGFEARFLEENHNVLDIWGSVLDIESQKNTWSLPVSDVFWISAQFFQVQRINV